MTGGVGAGPHARPRDGAAGPALAQAIRQLVRAALDREVLALDPLAGGLGSRRFFRVHLDGNLDGSRDGSPERLVARVEAPEDPGYRPSGAAPEPPLEPLRAWLEQAGLPVPRSYGEDPDAGIALLEDVGERSLCDAARNATPAERQRLYREAVAIVPRLQRVAAPAAANVAAFERHLDAELIRYKARLFCTWSLPQALGRPARPAEIAVVEAAFERIAEVATNAPQRLAHRDLQSQNLQVHPVTGALMLIDLQGALLAPPEYDLVCLLRDSYVELPENEVEALLTEVRPGLPDAPAPAVFAERIDLLTLSRKGKDHARFLQAEAGGDTRYRQYLPATVRALRRAAEKAGARDPVLARHAELIAMLPETPCAR